MRTTKREYAPATIRRRIGDRLCANGAEITTAKAIEMLSQEIAELSADVGAMGEALMELGMDRCDTSRQWLSNASLIKGGDRCQSVKDFDPDYFFREDDADDENLDARMVQVFREINSKGLTYLLDRFPHDKAGKLTEPYLGWARKSRKAAT